VDLWRFDQRDRSPELPGAEVLTSDEQERALRFRSDSDRERFRRCRCALRALISRYLEIPPSEIHFEYESSGKPRLEARQNEQQICFNLSHSGELAVAAVTAGHRVGIDVERVRDQVDSKAIIERYFSARERSALLSLPEDVRTAAFYACWTRKEALVKALGAGLSSPLANFSVTTNPNRAPALEEMRGDTTAGRQWLLADVPVAEGYQAALAVEQSLAPGRWNPANRSPAARTPLHALVTLA
jgi:4'-phosphopantetheinyl transferase